MHEDQDPQAYEALQLLALAIERRIGALRRTVRVAFMFLDGRRFLLDTAARPLLSSGVLAPPDVEVLCNGAGLLGLLKGTLSIERPREDQVFLCRGDSEAFSALADCLSGARSMLALRAGRGK